MTIVVKLGGTNGSGKTSVARALIDMLCVDSMSIHKKGKKVQIYNCKNWMVLGDYRNVCGGMDTISDKEDRLELVRYASEKIYSTDKDVVFFEGLITGKTYGAFGAMSEEPQHKGRWIYAFMDTPFEVCVERVVQRRGAAGNTTPFTPERTMRPTYKSVQATAKKAATQGHRVLWLPHKLKPAQIAQFLINEVKEFANADRV